jgi:DNA binding domain, excisionase family
MADSPSASTDVLISLEQAAQRLSMGVVTIKRMIRRGDLVGFKLGHNTIRVRLADLERWISSKQVQADASQSK